MYELLQSPCRIGSLTVPNRVFFPAMGVNLGAPEGGVTDDLMAYYCARARGGVGLIITEITRIDDGAGVGDPCQLAAYRASDIAGLQRLTDAVHACETKIFFQLQHPGRAASPFVTGVQPVAPSPVAAPGGDLPRELSTEECSALARKFAASAHIAQQAGADGVELHAAHGYLINQFLSPAMNFRTDRYGGSFENRLRFVLEILAGIHALCGQGFPVSVRINAEEALPGGSDLAAAVRIAVALEGAGAHAVNVSCLTEGCIEPGTYAQGWKKYMAAAVREAVGIPVLAVCHIKEPSVAENLLSGGVCHLVGVGRAQLADAAWCAKAFSGREEDIRPCIGCLACFSEICKLRRVKCAVNPLTGCERHYARPVKDGRGRVVAVIGAGPAGMQAALTLKERGFAPVLLDLNSRPGGALNTADKGYGKELITRYRDYLATQVRKAGIPMRLEEEASLESVRALDPAGVFVACGAEPFIPSLPGLDAPHVVTAEAVLLGRARPAGRVAVIGSGMTGLETAEKLALAGCRLALAEMSDNLGPGVSPLIVRDVLSRLLRHEPQIFTGHRLERVTERSVEMTRLADGQAVSAPADWVVLAMGVRPRAATVNAFCAAFRNVRVVGDAQRGGCILDATQDAHGKAFAFAPREQPCAHPKNP